MGTVALSLVKLVGLALWSMLLSLVTESFIKHAVVLGLEKLVAKTESDMDNKLLEEAKKAWDK